MRYFLFYNVAMNHAQWPDALNRPEPEAVQQLLATFWHLLNELPDLLARDEYLLAADCTAHLRKIVIEMMLALNGVAYPQHTRRLNSYLGESQRAALERTLLAPTQQAGSWIGQAVALVVIYRWYAPQLVNRFNLVYPQEVEHKVWQKLVNEIPDWPTTVATD